jgi:hypothetical protein
MDEFWFRALIPGLDVTSGAQAPVFRRPARKVEMVRNVFMT